MSAAQRIADASLGGARSVGAGALLLARTLRLLVTPPFCPLGALVQQCASVGVRSLPVILITGSFTGMVLAYESALGFKRFGAEGLISIVVSLSMVRELGPVLSGVMVAGRVGSAMAAELGTMRITEQIDALVTLATDPVRFLILPRLLAATLMLPCLVLFADLFGIVGGWFVAVEVLGHHPVLYEKRAVQFLAPHDLGVSVLKAAVFGATLAMVGCYEGFTVRGGAREVGRAVTRAVVLSLVLILTFDFLLTAWFFQ